LLTFIQNLINIAQVKDAALITGLSESLGKKITFRQVGGKTIISRIRKFTPPSKSVKAVSAREKFLSVIAHVKNAMTNGAVREF